MKKGCLTVLTTAILLMLGFGQPVLSAQQSTSESGEGTPKSNTNITLRPFSINLAPLTPGGIKGEQTSLDQERLCMTFMRRMFLWWQVEDDEGVVHHCDLQADNVVLFLSKQEMKDSLWGGRINEFGDILASDLVQLIYVSGDVVVNEGRHSIQCEELALDIHDQTGLAVKAQLKSFHPDRNIPIYVRAEQLLVVMDKRSIATDAVLTTSEFHTPQVSFSAARIAIVDNRSIDAMTGAIDQQYTAEMKDVRLNWYQYSLLAWPSMKMDLEYPDLPLKGISLGQDSMWGTTLETRWYLSRVLGLQEDEGSDSTLMLDYYGKRGPAAGIEIDYDKDNYFGNISGYVIKDWGLDRLGRNRLDLEPPHDVRGRFKIQHRQFLPYDWQVTTELSYLSDKNYLEQFERHEFNTEKEQETLLHIKRIQGNQGFSFLSKARLNDHQTQIEELPTVRFNWTGQSLFNNALTFYSNTFGGVLRYRDANDIPSGAYNKPFGAFYSRNELDLPLSWGKSKWVPYVAGTFGVDGGDGFTSNLDGQTLASEKDVLIGEAGLRLSVQPFWQTSANTHSRLLDLDGLRHVVQPELTLVGYTASEDAAEQRNAAIFSVRQRWQTKRGPANRRRVVDWLSWNTDFVWFSDTTDSHTTSQLTWNNPMIPMFDLNSGVIPMDRRSRGRVGPIHHYIYSDVALHLTDSTVVVADGHYDMVSEAVRQVNVGISHVRWPDLSYYIGSRYLRDVNNGLGQKGSHALTMAATYRLDPRYAVVISQQFDTDYGENIRSEISLLRKYHRLNYGLTFSVDESLDRTSIVFGLWPEGVSELGLGLSRYMDVGF